MLDSAALDLLLDPHNGEEAQPKLCPSQKSAGDLKLIPQELVIDVVVVLHFGRFDEGSE